MGHELELCGERLIALAEKALLWPAEATLFVADLHLGKGAAFRAAAFPVPEGSTAATLENLTCLLQKHGVKRLVLLGDLWHSKWARDDGTLARFQGWRNEHASVEMRLAVGNHDAKSGPLDGDGITISAEPFQLGPFICAHHPQEIEGAYVLCGHLHPSVTLEGKARLRSRLPCFWFCERYAVLPAFGELTGTADVSPCSSDSVLVIAAGQVLPIRVTQRKRAFNKS